ncbi:MAG: DEAD/DEAH box helicase, partial [Myxococcales bacterium]|nr:DEAD/DEAH box helicase [Myxococcales bacterium]
MSNFEALGLSEPLLRAVADAGYESPTPIQEKAIPLLLEGKDLLGCAQTGTGKTAAFALPTLHHLAKNPPVKGQRRPIRALVLSPTRELAAQIGQNFASYGRHTPLRHTVIFGGVKQGKQVRALQQGVDVLIATPGRLLDLIDQGYIRLGQVEVFILDEADRMLDMGFINPIRKVISLLPRERHNLLFSATMPGPIAKLASGMLHNPVRVDVAPQSTTAERVDQKLHFVMKADKPKLLVHLLKTNPVFRAIVFTRTKHGANRLTKTLVKEGIEASAIHGNKSQGARKRAIEGCTKGDIGILVATDIASRGIDVDDVSHVFNFDLPNESESYVHRIGRTGRAGRSGVAVAFCDEEETGCLADIEKLIGMTLPLDEDTPF